ncbi:phage portal protein [Leifsonia sp. NPDC058194]|uniref:phage portal protein n=1 Tax=Leifsonia sp. NPDC058194 TaxID=3346374 RepID=UPI0036DB9415
MSTVFVAPAVDLGTDQPLLQQLVNVWLAKHSRNTIRSVYYDGEAALKDFGIAVPPSMTRVGAALGWVAKGVHAVTDRSEFEGFVTASGGDDPFGLDEILDDNRFIYEFPAATVSSAVHGCSFLTVSQGATGEPDVLIIPRAAENSAAIWDRRRRDLKGFLSITDVDVNGVVSQMIMYTRERMYTLDRDSSGWSTDVALNPLGRVPVAPLVHKYELRRPLGHSRITRAAMYYSDAALRTILRSETSAEFYSADSYWLFGADVTKFVGDDKWSAVMGRVKALDIEDGDDKPDLHRFNGASPQPHVDQLRMWANLFADDQDMEVKFADASNPSSADAIFAAKETLITTTRDANKLWGRGAVEAAQMAVMLRDGLSEVPREMKALRAQFTDPAIVSPSARADAFSKLSASIAGFGTSEVGMEYAGLTREQIVRFQAEQRRASVGSLVQSLRDTVARPSPGQPAVSDTAG